jgi:hypothetical protein
MEYLRRKGDIVEFMGANGGHSEVVKFMEFEYPLYGSLE